MELFLGVDGGGTGCRAAVADLSGHVLGRGEAGGANIASDPDGAAANIRRAASSALHKAGASNPDIHRAVLGLAGANRPGAPERLAKALPYAGLLIVTDAITAARGALGEADGILAAIGTGSVFAVQRAGQIRQFGGYGLTLGDEGSGAWLGRALLARSLRAHDGILPMTALLAETLDRMGGPEALVDFAFRAAPADFAALAPAITASADPAALAVLAAAEAEVLQTLDALQAGNDCPVTFLGGLGPHYATRFQGRWPIRPAQGSALDGALHLALHPTLHLARGGG